MDDTTDSQLLKRDDGIQAHLQPEMLLKNATENFQQHHGVLHTIECGCCCIESQFETMVQCADGHLFCFQCLQKQVEEYTFGGMKVCSSLPCMDTNGCQDSIPMSQVRRALRAEVIERYEERQAQADIEQAKLDCLGWYQNPMQLGWHKKYTLLGRQQIYATGPATFLCD